MSHDHDAAESTDPVKCGLALKHIVALAMPVAFSMFLTASNSVMALGWVGQFLKSEVMMSGVSLGKCGKSLSFVRFLVFNHFAWVAVHFFSFSARVAK